MKIKNEEQVSSMTISALVDSHHPLITAEQVKSLKDLAEIPDLLAMLNDPLKWLDELLQMRRRVCKIKVGDVPGTGFLVAPNVVLTSYHLVDELIKEHRPGTAITVWFDYTPPSGTGDATGRSFKLDHEWCIAHGESSPVDNLPEADGKPPAPDELDYALLRLASAPGDNRGHIPVPAVKPAIEHGSPLCILQYPSDRSSKIAFSPHGADHLNANGTRLRHSVNTDDGSSGSPVFDVEWNLVALHRGYVRPPPGKRVELNDAIPIARIRDHFLRNPGISARVRNEVGWG
jgi:hypothetical protein